METVPFALYDAFSDIAYGGSQAGIVSNAAGVSYERRRRIAMEIGAPATAFVDAHTDHSITAQFFSTVMELPMCGHGTICLMTRMVENQMLGWNGNDRIDVELHLPSATATVEISGRADGRPLVMLDIRPPSFSRKNLDQQKLSELLGVHAQDYHQDLPIEIARGDFSHLVIPLAGLDAMRRITPDFDGLIQFCHEHDLETIAVFCTEVERPGNTLHVRDFCPAVGVRESAAAGTTNAALTSYLIRHKIIRDRGDGQIVALAEQGCEIERRSAIRSVVAMKGDRIARLQVGGVATKFMDGQLCLPEEAHCA